MAELAPLLQGFFTGKLMTGRQASPHTIAACRDTWALLPGYLAGTTGRQPPALAVTDLDAPAVGAFLNWLEARRGNSAATRNARLAAIRSFFRYAALRCPGHSASIARVLAIQPKRRDRAIISWLTAPEIAALLAAPDQASWHGRRDHALLAVAASTGLRVSELAALTLADTHLGAGPHLRCAGKGRRQRCTPLTRPVAALLAGWLNEHRASPDAPLFPARAGTARSRHAVARLVAKHAATAARACPSLDGKNVTPHTLRHSCAMALLEAGTDTSVTGLRLGHQSPDSTDAYLHASMAIKQRALDRISTPGKSTSRYRPPDKLLAFLKSP